MTGSGAPWRVALSSSAESELRALPPDARRRVAAVLDTLDRGLPADARPDPDDPSLRRVPVGGRHLAVLPVPGSRTLLVVRVAGPGEAATTPRAPGRSAAARLADVRADLRLALRSSIRSPAFTSAVVLTLVVALGGTAALFSTLRRVYHSPLPFEEGDRLVRLRSFAISAGGAERVYNMPDRDALAIRDGARTLSGLVAMDAYDLALPGGDLPERVRAVGVTAGWADVLGIAPVAGRPFSPEEEAAGAAAGVALISHALWQRRFGGEADAVGGPLRYDGGALTVVGVLPPGFRYPYDAEVWTPLRLDPANHTGHDLNVVARMGDGVDLEAVRADMARLYAALEEASPGTALDDGVHVATAREDYIRDDGRIVRALLVAVAFLLLLACVNVANLLTARFVARRREIGIRAALGAGRGRQVRQLLTETVVLFAAGGAGGLLLAAWLSDALAVLVPEVLVEQLDVGGGLDAATVAVALGLSVGAGLVFGLVAAARASGGDLHASLRDGGRGASGGGGRLQDGLVVAELALALVLLAGAGVMSDHFRRLRGRDPGFQLDGLHTMRVPLQQDRYASPEARGALVRALEARIGAEPEVEAVGVTSVNPLCCGDWGAPVRIEGVEPPADAAPLLVHHRYATPDYFVAMGIPLLRGSLFDPSDRPGSPPTVLVDESMARRFWPGEEAVGRRVRIDRPGRPWRTVVGVVGDVEAEGDYTEGWYLPFYQDPTGRSNEDLHLMVRVRGEGGVDAARRAVAAVDPALPTYEVTSMSALRGELLAQDRFGSVVSVAFAGFGLLLATFGLYGLLAYLVGRRSREIGTRIALGAPRGAVLRLVLGQAAALLAAGTAIGLAGAFGLSRVLERLVLGVEPPGPGLLLPLVAVLLVVAGAAALVPALRAARVDPVTAFRAD